MLLNHLGVHHYVVQGGSRSQQQQSSHESESSSSSDSEISDVDAPSKAHVQLRKGFRMSQLYLQRELNVGPSALLSDESADQPSGAAETKPKSANTTAGGTLRRKSSRLISAAASERRLGERA